MNDDRKQALLEAAEQALHEKTAQANPNGPVIKDTYTKDEVVALLKQASASGHSNEDLERAYLEGSLDGMRRVHEKIAMGEGADPRAPYGRSPSQDAHKAGLATDKANMVAETAAELEMRVDQDSTGAEAGATDPTEGAPTGGGGGQPAMAGGEAKEASARPASEEELFETLIKNAMEDGVAAPAAAGGKAGYSEGVHPSGAPTGTDGSGDEKHPDLSKNQKRQRDLSLGAALRQQVMGTLQAG